MVNVERADVREWLDILSAASNGKDSPKLWSRVRYLLEVPSRKRAAVNIYKINRYTKAGDNVVVPGKVLSTGSMDHKISIAAVEFSGTALERLRTADCSIVKIQDMLGAKKVSIII